ncbi:MAG: tetratricopeptide repeat protein [Pseudomonadota bacterium]|nr:tetratricopeptide repeat protein [Pseudomonadota bacterium]
MTKNKNKSQNHSIQSLTKILNSGIEAHKKNRVGEALVQYTRVLKLSPGHFDALHLSGLAFYQLGQFQKARTFLEQAISINNQVGNTYNTYASILLSMNLKEKAIQALERAVSLSPDHILAWNNLGSALRDIQDYSAAKTAYDNALKLKPDDPETLALSCFIRQHLCDWELLDKLRQRFSLITPQPSHERVAPFTVLSFIADASVQQKWARHFASEISKGLTPLIKEKQPPDSHNDPRIHIGYVSADFYAHATSFLLAEVIELHDRSRFKITGYSIGPVIKDDMHDRMMSAFDHFEELFDYSAFDIATKIRADGINLLIDLKGYTTGARPEIFCLKPAPVQISWLGYPGTLGMPSMDYLITDHVITPPESEPFFDERIIRLPDTYQCNDRFRVMGKPPHRSELDIPDQAFVFCAFNNAYKITPEIFTLWMRLLHKIPHSLLWLLNTHPQTKSNLLNEADKAGISPERVVFAPKLSQAEHLARIALADLFLDTAPINAHTTASDALWAGVPIITLTGQSFASRVAASLLHASGLPQLITHSPEEYELLAENLARDSKKLAEIRTYLREQRSSLTLFDTPKFTRNLEHAYIMAWEGYKNGLKPTSFNVYGNKKLLHLYAEGHAEPDSYGIPVDAGNLNNPFSSVPRPESGFDRVLITHVLEKIYDISSFLTDCWHLLSFSGTLELLVTNDLSFIAWSHPLNRRTFNVQSLKYLIEALPNEIQQQIESTSTQIHLSENGEKLKKDKNLSLEILMNTPRAVAKITFLLVKQSI